MLVVKIEKDGLTYSQFLDLKQAAEQVIEFAGMILVYCLWDNQVISLARIQISDMTIIKETSDYFVKYSRAFEEVKRAKAAKSNDRSRDLQSRHEDRPFCGGSISEAPSITPGDA